MYVHLNAHAMATKDKRGRGHQFEVQWRGIHVRFWKGEREKCNYAIISKISKKVISPSSLSVCLSVCLPISLSVSVSLCVKRKPYTLNIITEIY